MKRRRFLEGGALAAGGILSASCSSSEPESTQAGRPVETVTLRENGRYDILLKGGRVIDPANNVDATQDVAITDGKISAVRPDIAATDAKKTIDCSGLCVAPGFIDLHVHVYHTYPRYGVVADHHCFPGGVTTVLDVGTAGASNFQGLKEIIDSSRVRIFALINVSNEGMGGGEQDPRTYLVDEMVRVAKEFPDDILGFKIAHYWTTQPYDDLHTPWANVDAVMKAGRQADLPVMYDWFPRPASEGYPARSYRELILEKSRPGDIHTHCYARHIPVIGEDGKVNPDIFKAKERGFIFDLGHGAGSFVYRNAVPAIEQGYVPDALGTDLHRGNVNGPVLNQAFVMSKILSLGVPLADVVSRVTDRPARIMRRTELGTLGEGRVADVAVFDVRSGKFTYLDTSGGKMAGDKMIEPVMTIASGDIVFDPTGLSYPVWQNIPKDDDYWVNQSGQFF